MLTCLGMKLFNRISNFLEKFFGKLITFVSLFLTYFLGIGLTAIVAKIFNKKFLDSAKNSTWKKANYKTNLRKMF